ncbi:hypothetical protein GYMLUDRAFT_248309 [Collybiopsis luxurians FD-317 M1]|uniref:Uncharacterized protein n=1 Tax=Collybiopsis luxurians FD-317 M1 TaxID=944289 RepID=A0A0D0CL87_9AGAR|nr:hypothetical protein GYMLUDRAFT_248309 [Collybiopsis luxurians FD-317 M1]
MFYHARNPSISQSDLTVVYGNQTNIHRYPRSRDDYEDELDENIRRKRHRQYSYVDDFKEVRRGDMIVLQRMPSGLDSLNQLSVSPPNRITACQQPSATSLLVKIEVVRLASKKQEKKFMAITYEGDGAHEATATSTTSSTPSTTPASPSPSFPSPATSPTGTTTSPA